MLVVQQCQLLTNSNVVKEAFRWRYLSCIEPEWHFCCFSETIKDTPALTFDVKRSSGRPHCSFWPVRSTCVPAIVPLIFKWLFTRMDCQLTLAQQFGIQHENNEEGMKSVPYIPALQQMLSSPKKAISERHDRKPTLNCGRWQKARIQLTV